MDNKQNSFIISKENNTSVRKKKLILIHVLDNSWLIVFIHNNINTEHWSTTILRVLGHKMDGINPHFQ